MRNKILTALFLCLGTVFLPAQDLSNIQIHGFVTQGFIYSTNNNYLSMDSSNGSFQWTDGAVSLNDSLSDKLRVGIQLHMYQLGQFGGDNVVIDWASADYKVNENLGFRAGKVKLPFGLFNDSQDVDAVHLWALLPEFFYSPDNKDTYLSALGGETYGGVRLGKKAGTLLYRGYTGYRYIQLNSGYTQAIESGLGLNMTTPPSGRIAGGDLRWQTPVKGLEVGVSDYASSLNATGTNGSFISPMFQQPDYYAQYEKGKFAAAGEYRRFAPGGLVTLTGLGSFPLAGLDDRGWYAMGSYRVTSKLQLGSYYDHVVNKGAADTSLASEYFKDWTISSRYDFNDYFYGKLEEHFVRGTGQGYYAATNADLKPNSNILAVKFGFTF